MKSMPGYRVATIICIGMALATCGNEDDDLTTADDDQAVAVVSPPAQPGNGYVSPKPNRTNTLAGPDVDNNGVRDDIDAYITRNFPDPKQRAAVLQLARAMQKALLVNVTSKEATRAASIAMIASINCVSSTLPRGPNLVTPPAVGAKIEAMTTNTKARLKAYRAYDKSLEGVDSILPAGDSCE